MNKFYITFGQTHIHMIGTTLLDKDGVLEIEDEDFIQAVAWTQRTFGPRFANIHQYPPRDMSYYPRGIINLEKGGPARERGAGKWIIVNTSRCPMAGEFYIDADGVIKEARKHEGTLRTIVRWEADPPGWPKVTMEARDFEAALFTFGSEKIMFPKVVAPRLYKGLRESGIEVEIKG